jgi:hypothetical protein
MKSKTHPVTDDEPLGPTEKSAELASGTPAAHTVHGPLLARRTAVGIVDGAHCAKPMRRRRPRTPGG